LRFIWNTFAGCTSGRSFSDDQDDNVFAIFRFAGDLLYLWIIKAFSVISVPSVVGLKYATLTALDFIVDRFPCTYAHGFLYVIPPESWFFV
jgi:hypothetical protein